MFTLKLGPLFAGLCAILAQNAIAQQPTTKLLPPSKNAAAGSQDQTIDPFIRVESIIGARVRLIGDDDANEAAEIEKKEGEAPVLVPLVSRLVIDTSTGRIDSAVISSGSWIGSPVKFIAVPMSAMRRDQQVRDTDALPGLVLILDATRERIAALPAFDMKNVDKRGLVAVLQAAKVAWEHSARPSTDGAIARPASARRSDEAAMTLILTEQIRPAQVLARDAKFGTIEECFADSDCQQLRFVVVATEGTNLLMPFSVLHFVQRSEGDEWLIDQPATSLREHGVEYQKPPDQLIEPAAAKKAVDAYQISKR